MRIVLSFLTRLPVGSFTTEHYFRDLGRRAPLFPLAGLVIGLLSAAAAWLAGLGFGEPVGVVAAMVVNVAVTGGLHLDGLMDTADGIMSHRSRERMLEIMHDSRIGAMAVIAVLMVVLLRFALLAATPAPQLWRALVIAPVLGRAAVVAAAGLSPQACAGADLDGRGLGADFAANITRGGLMMALVIAVVAAAVIGGWRGAAASVTAGIVAGLSARGLIRTLRGLTGDTLGAINELSEIAALAAFAFIPRGFR